MNQTLRERETPYLAVCRQYIYSDKQRKGHVARAMLRFQNYTDRPTFKSWLCHLFAVYPWASHPAFLSLSFLVCKMGITYLPEDIIVKMK
mgnify:CR=1 FL=1